MVAHLEHPLDTDRVSRGVGAEPRQDVDRIRHQEP
jgi:hypothetical protein